MSYNSKIEWTEHTFNPWHGCAKVSPGCKHCYAETLTNRWGGDYWGIHSPRKFMSDSYWRKPLEWNRKAAAAGRRDRVFCASMADVFERHPIKEINEQMNEARSALWRLIEETDYLIWLLLTKRPINAIEMTPVSWLQGWPANVCIMTSVEDQERADERIPTILQVPAMYRGLSVEPLLKPIDLSKWLSPPEWYGEAFGYGSIDWVIVGGESGPGARPMHPEWALSIRDQCQASRTPFFFKQWGEWVMGGSDQADRVGKKTAGRLLDGREWNEHPFCLEAEVAKI